MEEVFGDLTALYRMINVNESEIEHAFYRIKSILFTMQLTFQFYFRVKWTFDYVR